MSLGRRLVGKWEEMRYRQWGKEKLVMEERETNLRRESDERLIMEEEEEEEEEREIDHGEKVRTEETD